MLQTYFSQNFHSFAHSLAGESRRIIPSTAHAVKTNYQLLEIMAADPAVAPIFDKMKPIMATFSSPEFTAKQLTEVVPLISSLRQEIIK